MKIGFLVERQYEAHAPSASLASVQDRLLHNGFVVVMDQGHFGGLVTPADVVRSGGRRLEDCLSDKPRAAAEDEVADVLRQMVKAGVSVLPVFRGDVFVGVVCRQRIADWLLQERNRLQSRIGERQAALLHLGRLSVLGEMASGIAHELNQPLAAILTHGDACLRLTSAPAPDMRRIGRNLREILAQGERAGVIIRRMRALAQGRPSRFGAVDLNDVVRNAIALVRWDLSQNETTLRLELAEGLPPAYVDAIQIEQVLLNLIRNAIEAMRHGEAGPRILTLRTAASDGRMSVEVRDTGVGLPRAQEERIFEPFFTTKPDGLGLGLWLCRAIVEGHRGALVARSNPDSGATFLLTLPARRAADVEPDSLPAETRSNEGKNIKDAASRCPIYTRGQSQMA